MISKTKLGILWGMQLRFSGKSQNQNLQYVGLGLFIVLQFYFNYHLFGFPFLKPKRHQIFD